MKRWYQSRTLWINVLLIAAALVEVWQNSDLIPIESEHWVLIISTINVGLRFATNKPLSYGKEEKAD